MKSCLIGAASAAAFFFIAGQALATPFTMTSPNGDMPAGVSETGGFVFDIVGLNGTRIVSQASGDGWHYGTNWGPVHQMGYHYGYEDAITDQLGGGIASLSLRVTLFDGDNAENDFDWMDDELWVNGASLGNFSEVWTQITEAGGAMIGDEQWGFPNDETATGWFELTDADLLRHIYTQMLSIKGLHLIYNDSDPGDQGLSFRKGSNIGPIVYTPVTEPPPPTQPGEPQQPYEPPPVKVPAPAPLGLLLFGLAGLGLLRRLRA